MATGLRHEEYLMYDDELMDIAREELNGVQDLMTFGLTKMVQDIGVTVAKYERVGDMTGADVSMDGKTKGQSDTVLYDEVGTPIPIIHKEWELHERQLLASRRRGEPLDTTLMRVAARKVLERMEDMLFNGNDITVDSHRIYGYRTYPHRNTVTLSGGSTGWSNVASRDIIGDINKMAEIAHDNKVRVPMRMYVASNMFHTLENDYSAAKGDKTWLERMLAYTHISSIVPTDSLPDNEVLMVKMSKDTVEWTTAADVMNMHYGNEPLFHRFKIWGAAVPIFKSDQNNNCGIIHGITA